MPAPVQITAEQLLREAKERELELVQPVLLKAFFKCFTFIFYLTSVVCISVLTITL